MTRSANKRTANTLAIVLAGGQGSRLGALTRRACKPALPFGGIYHNIDFALSNCLNSGIRNIGIATQHLPESLNQHVRQDWQKTSSDSSFNVELWPAHAQPFALHYRGTADAVRRNWHRIEATDPQTVLILAGDHIYKMDYRKILAYHHRVGAAATVGCIPVPLQEASRFGVMTVDDDMRIRRFAEKPSAPEPMPGRSQHALASMGIYVFETKILHRLLSSDGEAPDINHDFGSDILPSLIGQANVYAYPFQDDSVGHGYWRDVGTLSDYWRAHMDLLEPNPTLILNDGKWPLHGGDHRSGIFRPESVSLPDGTCIQNSILTHESQVVGASVTHSVLSQDVRVGPRTTVFHSVVLPGAVIGSDCQLYGVIVDADCQVPDGTVIGLPKIGSNEFEFPREPPLLTNEVIAAGAYSPASKPSVGVASVA